MKYQNEILRRPGLTEGLLLAAGALSRAGRKNSALSIARNAAELSDNSQELRQCLEFARSYDDILTISECLDRSTDVIKEHNQRIAFADEARRTRFAVLQRLYLDMTTPFRELIVRKRAIDAAHIIYADIDLNTVDGSAIWMASVTKVLSSQSKVIVISKNAIHRDAVIGDLLTSENVTFITPGNTDFGSTSMSIDQCIALIKDLDGLLPNLRAVVVRGLAAIDAVMADRQLYRRVYAYLTDIYEHIETGIRVRPESAAVVDIVSRQAAGFLVQTPNIKALLEEISPLPPKVIDLPPPIPDSLIRHEHAGSRGKTLRIGYAGKIAPQWGIYELADWVENLRASGLAIEVTIIGDKVSGAGDAARNKTFRHEIALLLTKIGARQLGAMGRNETMCEMQRMDFAWCWRPPEFESHTLELSSKLVESVASGIPSIAYPSKVNVSALGSDYPFFATDVGQLKDIVDQGRRDVPMSTRSALHSRHSYEHQSENLGSKLLCGPPKEARRLAIASHDFKFCHAYYSVLKRHGLPVVLDEWAWGAPIDEARSEKILEESDIVLCEWGLANAVWYSRHKRHNQRLVVRVHAQEVRAKAERFGRQIAEENVDCFIFVAEWVRRRAIALFGWPEERTLVIPNFVLEDEYVFGEKAFSGPVRLGMVGILPFSKRLDRALDLVEILEAQGCEAELHLKGPLPRDAPFMRAKNRADEMAKFDDLFQRIASSSVLKKTVHTHGWGNNVAAFYGQIDHILSPSDSESFHYALADGVLSGCHPIVWQRDEAAHLFSDDWIVRTTQEAADRIIAFRRMDRQSRNEQLESNRRLLVSRYGSARIFAELNDSIYGEVAENKMV